MRAGERRALAIALGLSVGVASAAERPPEPPSRPARPAPSTVRPADVEGIPTDLSAYPFLERRPETAPASDLTSLAVAASDPRVLYVGTAGGRLLVSRDAGLTWDVHLHDLAVPGIPWWLGGGTRLGFRGPEEAGPAATAQPSPWDVFEFIDLDDELVPLQDPALLAAQQFEAGLEATAGPSFERARRASGRFDRVERLRELDQSLVVVPNAPRPAVEWLRGDATDILGLAVDPADADRLLLATTTGLRRSDDGGRSSTPVPLSRASEEPTAYAVAFAPGDPRRVLVASDGGLFVSQDGGRTFAPSDAPVAAGADARALAFATDGGLCVATAAGALWSDDGGARFHEVLPAALEGDLTGLSVAPVAGGRARCLLGTSRGLFAVVPGERLTAMPGLVFAEQPVPVLAASRHPGHLVAGTALDLWQTLDGGQTWRSVYFGASTAELRGAAFSGDTLHVWTDTTIAAPAPGPDALWTRAEAAALRDELRGEPTAAEALRAALGRADVEPEADARRPTWARLAGLLPRVHAGAVLRDHDLEARRVSFSFDPDRASFESRGPLSHFAWSVVGTWDLAETIYAADEAPAPHVRAAEAGLRETVLALYEERRHLLIAQRAAPPEDARARLQWALRLEELTAHLNVLTGELFAPAPAW